MLAADLAQLIGNDAVLRSQSLATIDQQDNTVGLIDRLQCLPCHRTPDHVLGNRLKATGINHEITFVAQTSAAIMAITGESRHIRDDGISAAREAVEKRRLADVWTADDY